MKTCYLAGPYTADTTEKEIQNKLKALKGAKFLMNQGYCVFSPHWNFVFAEEQEKEKIMKMCIEFVKLCEVFVLLPSWRNSSGCMQEYNIAIAAKKEILYLTKEEIGL